MDILVNISTLKYVELSLFLIYIDTDWIIDLIVVILCKIILVLKLITIFGEGIVWFNIHKNLTH